MRQDSLLKWLSILSFLALFGAVLLLLGMRMAKNDSPLYRFVVDKKQEFDLIFSERGVLTGTLPNHHLAPVRVDRSGVTVNRTTTDDYVLVASFYDRNNQIRLMERDGTVVHSWNAVYSELFPAPDFLPNPPRTDWNVDLHGVVALPDGSVVFNFEYSGLAKLDRNGAPVWVVRQPTHHSVEMAEDGTFWVPSRRFVKVGEPSPIPFLKPPYNYDTLLHVAPDGTILKETAFHDIFINSGLEAVFTVSLQVPLPWRDGQTLHSNKITVLDSRTASAFEDFEAGDLLVSFRRFNLVMVIDQKTMRAKWWQIGPWLRQHDPEFGPDGRFHVFNNNCYLTDQGRCPSNIIAIDPGTRQSEVVYGGSAEQPLDTFIRGKHELTPDGGHLITEFDGGRAFQVDGSGEIVWEYINRYDEEHVAEITEARAYPRSYFKNFP